MVNPGTHQIKVLQPQQAPPQRPLQKNHPPLKRHKSQDELLTERSTVSSEGGLQPQQQKFQQHRQQLQVSQLPPVQQVSHLTEKSLDMEEVGQGS